MKAKKLALMVLLLAAPGLGFATGKIVHFPVQNAIDAATNAGKLDGTVKFYFAGNAPDGQVTVMNNKVMDNEEINRDTHALGKNDQTTCDEALQSLLISLQDQAKKAGANAVVDIVSNYSHEYRDSQNYECHVGLSTFGVMLKGKLAKVQ
jgi:uncharacterized protein YbjQ (UPF0145 family)